MSLPCSVATARSFCGEGKRSVGLPEKPSGPANEERVRPHLPNRWGRALRTTRSPRAPRSGTTRREVRGMAPRTSRRSAKPSRTRMILPGSLDQVVESLPRAPRPSVSGAKPAKRSSTPLAIRTGKPRLPRASCGLHVPTAARGVLDHAERPPHLASSRRHASTPYAIRCRSGCSSRPRTGS